MNGRRGMSKKITVWYCKNKKGIFEHNHFEYGHLDTTHPTPMFESQKVWLNREWKSKHKYLNSDNVICDRVVKEAGNE